MSVISMYDVAITPLIRTLTNLSGILKKGEAYAEAKKIEPAVLLNARLFPDMYPLLRQVQLASDFSKGAGARLAGIEIPKYEDTEVTFDELHARIAKTIAFLETIKPAQLIGSESREIVITVRKAELKFTGQNYLLRYAVPNVYFHVTTAYNILRHNGVELGKKDFLASRD